MRKPRNRNPVARLLRLREYKPRVKAAKRRERGRQAAKLDLKKDVDR